MLKAYRHVIVFIAIVGSFLALSCEKVDTDLKIAQSKVEEFRYRVKSEKYDEIYMDASDIFKESGSLEEMKKYIVSAKLGYMGRPRVFVDWKVGVNAKVGYIILLYYADDLEHNGLNEEFVFMKEANEFRLMNYRAW